MEGIKYPIIYIMRAEIREYREMSDFGIESFFFSNMLDALKDGPEHPKFAYYLGVARNHRDEYREMIRTNSVWDWTAQEILDHLTYFHFEHPEKTCG